MNSGPKATQDSWSKNPDHPDRADWVELAVDAGKSSLSAQREELTGMRTRAVAFAALTITGSAFLVGTGLSQALRNEWFYLLAVMGTLAFAALACLLVVMVSPAFRFRFILDPKVLIGWMDGATPAPSKTVAKRKLAAEVMPQMLEDNEKSLRKIRKIYRAVLITAAATLALWVSVVWIFA